MGLSEMWVDFWKTEFCFFELSISDVVWSLLMGMVMQGAIRLFGPSVLRGVYRARVESLDNDNDGAMNLAYRIVAPVVWAYILYAVIYLSSGLFGEAWLLEVRWLPVLLYWVCRFVVISGLRDAFYPVWATLIQAMASIGTAIYFDWAVVVRIADHGILAFDNSNIGWQFLAGGFIVVIYMVLWGLNKSKARRENDGYGDPVKLDYPDRKTEAKLHGYLRSYSSLLPARFTEDYLLEAFLYSVMLIEDSNRPRWVRVLERTLFFTGLVKTTGIMQVKSARCLSDDESVVCAAMLIQDIWDEYLRSVAMGNKACDYPIVSFCATAYRYSYASLKSDVLSSSTSLYGRYCGTGTLRVESTFAAVIAFMEQQKGFHTPGDIWVRSDLFEIEAGWIADGEICYKDGVISLTKKDDLCLSFRAVIRGAFPTTRSQLGSLVNALRQFCVISSIELHAGCYVRLEVQFREASLMAEAERMVRSLGASFGERVSLAENS